MTGKDTGWKIVVLIYSAVFLSDFFTFFAKCDLIRLRSTPTKFREAALGRYEAMLKLVKTGLYNLY